MLVSIAAAAAAVISVLVVAVSYQVGRLVRRRQPQTSAPL
jgi:hypothetical protein